MGDTTYFGQASGNQQLNPSSQSDTWNIADGYVKIKILKLVIEVDLYETIAYFGQKDLDENNSLPEKVINYKRVEAMTRLLFCLKQLLGNCYFSVLVEDRYKLKFFTQRLDNIENVLSGIADEVYNDLTKETEIKINENHFRTCLKSLQEIKNDINVILNNAGLIFRKSDNTSIDDIMKQIVEGG